MKSSNGLPDGSADLLTNRISFSAVAAGHGRRRVLRSPDVFSVNILFWKIRVTRVQQKIFHRDFSVSAKHFRPAGHRG
jgi:hypothetical protein